MAKQKKTSKVKVRNLKPKAAKGKKRGLSDKELDNVMGGLGRAPAYCVSN